ncbi:MAG: hypothetical protein IKP60_13930 [Treponema sp.]|nr:hypothetical protein [Treponema sp.]
MFEKEAEEYVNKDTWLFEIARQDAKYHFQQGAEFGYNKANEWHYTGIPNDNKPYLCKVEQPTKFDTSEYEILFFDDKEMSWFRWLTLWSGEEGNEHVRINRKVIAWKEITLPKEMKEK